jgi:hypothetical protein
MLASCKIKCQHKIFAKKIIFKAEANVSAEKLYKIMKKKLKKGVGSGDGSGSGSISQKCGSADPDPHQKVTDPQHWFLSILPELI